MEKHHPNPHLHRRVRSEDVQRKNFAAKNNHDADIEDGQIVDRSHDNIPLPSGTQQTSGTEYRFKQDLVKFSDDTQVVCYHSSGFT